MSIIRTTSRCGEVIKTYKDSISSDMDANMLRILAKYNLSPSVKWRDGLSTCRTYIQGATILECLNAYDKGDLTKEEIEGIFSCLLKWVEVFNEVTYQAFGHFIKLTHLDLNKFINEDNQIVGIDFEVYEPGKKEDNFVIVLTQLSLYPFENERCLNHLINYIQKSLKHYIPEDILKTQVDTLYKKELTRRMIYSKCKNITCVILSGGKNTRMGKYKSELKIGQYSFMDHLIYQNTIFKEIVLSVNQIALYEKYHQHMILDSISQIGPLGGIYSVLKNLLADKFFICTCDSPFISFEVYQALVEKEEENYDGIVACINGKVNPLLAVYKRRIIKEVEALIKDKNYRMMSLLDNLYIKYVEVGHWLPEETININTPKLYETFINHSIKYKSLFALCIEWDKKINYKH